MSGNAAILCAQEIQRDTGCERSQETIGNFKKKIALRKFLFHTRQALAQKKNAVLSCLSFFPLHGGSAGMQFLTTICFLAVGW